MFEAPPFEIALLIVFGAYLVIAGVLGIVFWVIDHRKGGKGGGA